MEEVVAEVNGGNAEMAQDDTNLETTDTTESEVTETSSKTTTTTTTTESQDDTTETPAISTTAISTSPSTPPPSTTPTVASANNDTTETETTIKMEVDEVNGDVKDDEAVVKKIGNSTKRKLRKSKSNSTSSVETDTKLKTRGQKRKSPDLIDNNVSIIKTDDSSIDDDFFGFDITKIDDNRAFQILQKLIAETESGEISPLMSKRKRLLPKLNRQKDDNNEMIIDNDVKTKTQIETDKLKNDVKIINNNTTIDKTSESLKLNEQRSIYTEPFKYGWRRELIWKGLPDSNQKRSADIYYYSPKGKKLKSLKEISECLTTKELTLDNFTFINEPIGVKDPALEIIRDAKRLRSDSTGGTPSKKIVATKRTSISKKLPSPTQVVVTSKTPTNKLSSPKNNASAGFKVKMPIKRSSIKKDIKTTKDPEMLPPQWSSSSSTTPSRKSQGTTEKSLSPKNKKLPIKKKLPMEMNPRDYFMVSVCAGYNALSRIFQYLKVQELLRASRVCRMWRDIAAQQVLWKTVRMKNSQVTDWDGLVACLKRHGTQHLDLRKMIISDEPNNCWDKFIKVIPSVTSIKKLDLCRCPANVVQDIMKNCPHIEILNATSIQCQSLNIDTIENMTNCQELKLKALNGMSLKNNITPIEKLNKLSLLSLTSIKDLGKQNIEAIGSLINLTTLELGECSDFPSKFGTDVLSKLNKLEKIRLEKGQNTCCTFEIIDGISKLESIQQVELINFDIKIGFDKCIASCSNIKRLLIIPTYVSQSATSNNMILSGVTKLSDTLTDFIWGITTELLGVTELFVSQSADAAKQKSLKNLIPVSKPVPCYNLIENIQDDVPIEKDKKEGSTTNPSIEVLALHQLTKLLLAALPKTRIKILTTPFAATWRQSISDTISQ